MAAASPPLADSSFEVWEEQVCRTFVPLRARTASETVGFRGAVTSADLGQVTLADVTASRALVERTPRLIRQGDPELYKFGLQVAGTCVVEQAGRQAFLRPGDFAIYDTSRPYQVSFSDDFRMTVAMFPRRMVHLPASQMASLTAVRLAGDSGLGTLLTPLMRGLTQEMDTTGGVIADHVGDALVHLVTAAFAQQLAERLPEDSPSAQRRLMIQVRRFIEGNLADPDLSSRTVAAAHFVSLRQLQKLFAAEGESVTSIIRAQRLDCCRRDLADPRLAQEPIASVGARWGFPDAAHFSRLFRATFGVSPREFRLRPVDR